MVLMKVLSIARSEISNHKRILHQIHWSRLKRGWDSIILHTVNKLKSKKKLINDIFGVTIDLWRTLQEEKDELYKPFYHEFVSFKLEEKLFKSRILPFAYLKETTSWTSAEIVWLPRSMQQTKWKNVIKAIKGKVNHWNSRSSSQSGEKTFSRICWSTWRDEGHDSIKVSSIFSEDNEPQNLLKVLNEKWIAFSLIKRNFLQNKVQLVIQSIHTVQSIIYILLEKAAIFYIWQKI